MTRLEALGRSLLLLALLPLLQRRYSVQDLVTRLTVRPRTPVGRPTAEAVDQVREVVDAVCHKRPFRAYGPCLRRALVLSHLLTRIGLPVRVALGARLQRGEFMAHAWVTLDGAPFLEPDVGSAYTQVTEWGGWDDNARVNQPLRVTEKATAR